ncbi:MAG: cytochrome c [Sulfuricellaceae bacterium]|nr:cytochrome c [Sulfuricellaceae bacterium]
MSIRTLLPAAVLLSLAVPALATPKPEDAIKYRQGVYEAIKWNFGTLAAMTKGEVPYNKEEAVHRAELLTVLAKMPLEGFAPGTDKGAKTAAKAKIWQDRAKFENGFKQLQAETAKLADAAKSGDAAALKAQVGATGKTCKACHDAFREE